MLIRDLEMKSGLDRATIRFYEKEGLIKPERKENGYRNYTEENLNDIMKIKLLRQLGMSLDRIKSIQQGSADLQGALSEQILILERQIREAQHARSVCLQMQSDRVRYADLDVKLYLNALQGPQIAPVKKEFKERVSREYHPHIDTRWHVECHIVRRKSCSFHRIYNRTAMMKDKTIPNSGMVLLFPGKRCFREVRSQFISN